MQWVCTICGYVHDEEEIPSGCPVCGAPANKFTEWHGVDAEGAGGPTLKDASFQDNFNQDYDE